MSSCRKQCTMGSHIVLLLAVCTTMLSVGAFVAGWLQQFCWMYSSVRQTNRLRGMYLRGILRQDIGFFDTQATTGGLLQGLNEDSLAIQQAISDKVSQHGACRVLQYTCAQALAAVPPP
eukprot:GHRR01037634.1.p1 GENE.GHRR01037634.1~~GHRR01037634.1.p1  ORF type:complete len:119 (-),score=30.78 GHRR01037634.1:337-693(-)